MNGMDARTGKPLSGLAHLEQSTRDILTTPIGSRVGRRDYGSEVPDLIDRPNNQATAIRLYAATAMALMRWEPRLRLTRVTLQRDGARAALTLDGRRIDLPTNPGVQIAVPLR